jgi:hypothetical protein
MEYLILPISLVVAQWLSFAFKNTIGEQGVGQDGWQYYNRTPEDDPKGLSG